MNAHTAHARETARLADGRFGEQNRSAEEVVLDGIWEPQEWTDEDRDEYEQSAERMPTGGDVNLFDEATWPANPF